MEQDFQRVENLPEELFKGRLDLTQAEAVMDIIRGKTENLYLSSLDQLRGDLKEQIWTLKKISARCSCSYKCCIRLS